MKTKWQTKWLSMDVTKSPDLERVGDIIEAYCGRWFRNQPTRSLLVLCGIVRTGKTHLAKKIHRFGVASAFTSYEKGVWKTATIPSVDFISWPELACELSEKNRSYIEDAFKSSLLILDDVGAENDPWKICTDVLCQILSRRETMFTVITTNIMPLAWTEKFDVRISDRLMRNSIVVDLSEVKPYQN